MKKAKIILGIGVALALVFVAGFFYEPMHSASTRDMSRNEQAAGMMTPTAEYSADRYKSSGDVESRSGMFGTGDVENNATQRDFASSKVGNKIANKPTTAPALIRPAIPAKSLPMLQLLQDKPYKRQATFHLQVKSAIEIEEKLEKSLTEQKGELIELSMEGSKNGRRGTLTAQVLTAHFNDFVRFVRESGEVLSENITAKRIEPSSSGRQAPSTGEVDYRELALVTITFAETVALEAAKGEGILATSLHNSSTHFLEGIAVILEVLGYGMPFVFIVGLIAVPLWLLLAKKRGIVSQTTSVPPESA
ncbi:MAG: hypothetical protein A2W23_08875 [Planctomycetes bacterium RBG_16_43_13]|nr:MAG: hypothetical protein A2W23_08875 [Planctomycetes bacterium RBG_16_43_13]